MAISRKSIRKRTAIVGRAWLSIKKRAGVFLTYLTAIVIGGFAAYQYFDSKWKTRIDRTLQYVLLYQEPEKVAARNNLDLEPTEGLRDLFTPPSESGPVAANKLVDPGAAEEIVVALAAAKEVVNAFAAKEVVSEQLAIPSAVTFAETPFDVKERAARGNLSKCEHSIEEYAQNAAEIGSLSAGEFLELADGKTVTKYSNGDLWWEASGITYYYAWPDIVWRFFHRNDSQLNESDKYKINECTGFLRGYEFVLGNKMRTSLHELKHFYAALSMCTLSGVCDSYVACESFSREVGTFLTNWAQYLELWDVIEQKSQYDRLHEFVEHCWRNRLFVDHSSLKKWERWYDPAIFYVQQFTNLAWEFDRGEDDWF